MNNRQSSRRTGIIEHAYLGRPSRVLWPNDYEHLFQLWTLGEQSYGIGQAFTIEIA